MKAVVYKSTGSWYVVKNEAGDFYNARIKGKFKLDEITSSNPVAVGDVVEANLEDTAEENLIIHEIHQRKNYITRQSPHNKRLHHIVAANLDQSILLATIKQPRTSTGFIDRFLVASEAYHVPAVLVYNKSDLYSAKDMAKFEQVKEVYQEIGYPVYLISVSKGEGIDEIRELLKDKITLISGHSGVGKSSFINEIFPEKSLKTREVSGWSGKGMHTTTFAEMFDLDFGGKIIDTPGMREFGLMDFEKQELSHYFVEMKALIHDCRFNNCLHVEEPGCAVKAAVEDGKIHLERYFSYLNILETVGEKEW